ncbi:MAG: PQQ-binding-like beta-propeller repeat protein [Gemmataceae bacterium]
MRLALLVALIVTTANLRADEWPQWMGPKRDNVWREDGIVDKFPSGGPKRLWRADVAGGYAGPAVAGGRVVVTDYVSADNVKVDNFQRKTFTGTERVLCLNAADGEVIWRHEYPVKYTMSYPAGPRCTPVIHDGKVYTLGAEGHLFCFTADRGQIVWSKDFAKDYGAKTALWGYASHPLIDGKKLLCVVGGDGSQAVAFDKDTGAEIWKAQSAKEQGYCPPTIIMAGGKRQLILVKPDGVASVDPETGKEYWSTDYEASNGSVIMSPVVLGEYLYVGGFSNKNLLLKLAKDKPAAEVVWRDKAKHGVAPVNVQPIVEGNTIYGFDQNGELFAVEIPSGKRLWTTPKPVAAKAQMSGTAFLVKQNGRYWLFNDSGELIIAKLSPEKYEEIERSPPVLEPTNNAFGRPVVWCMPAFANKRMYVRNDKELVCVDLAK